MCTGSFPCPSCGPTCPGDGPRLWGRVPSPKCSQVFNCSLGTPASPAKCRKAAKDTDRAPATSLWTCPGLPAQTSQTLGLDRPPGSRTSVVSVPLPQGSAASGSHRGPGLGPTASLSCVNAPHTHVPPGMVALSPLLPGTLRTELCPCSVPPALHRDVCQPRTAPRGAPARPAAPLYSWRRPGTAPRLPGDPGAKLQAHAWRVGVTVTRQGLQPP